MLATEWGSCQYTLMPFGLKNASCFFSRVVITTFKEYIHKFLEVYLDDWVIFVLLKKHVVNLGLMLDTCRKYQILLNLKKRICFAPFGIFLAHVVCKSRLMVDLEKIAVIVNLPAPKIVRQLCTTLRHTSYYRKFIKGYAPMEKLLKKDVTLQWDEE